VTKKAQTILLAVIGVVAILVIAIVGVGVWVARSMVNNTDMDQASATQTMEDVRARFAHATPVLDIRPGALTMSRRPPDVQPPGELKTLHILRWDVHEERLTRVDVPFWLLRMRNGPIDVMYEGDPNPSGLRMKTSTSIRVADIERFGPALLVDGDMPDGGHVVIWSE
jgi:hypothetical protein